MFLLTVIASAISTTGGTVAIAVGVVSESMVFIKRLNLIENMILKLNEQRRKLKKACELVLFFDPLKNRGVAQLVEQWSFKPVVRGSNPCAPKWFFNKLCKK